jgi:hypothetical protein
MDLPPRGVARRPCHYAWPGGAYSHPSAALMTAAWPARRADRSVRRVRTDHLAAKGSCKTAEDVGSGSGQIRRAALGGPKARRDGGQLGREEQRSPSGRNSIQTHNQPAPRRVAVSGPRPLLPCSDWLLLGSHRQRRSHSPQQLVSRSQHSDPWSGSIAARFRLRTRPPSAPHLTTTPVSAFDYRTALRIVRQLVSWLPSRFSNRARIWRSLPIRAS